MSPAEYKAAREKLGLTQAELAGRLGVPRETISRRENGIQSITEEMALALRALKPSKTKNAPGGSNVIISHARTADEDPNPPRKSGS